MKKIKTEFTTHEEANEWAERNGYTVIMSALTVEGVVQLTVIGGE